MNDESWRERARRAEARVAELERETNRKTDPAFDGGRAAMNEIARIVEAMKPLTGVGASPYEPPAADAIKAVREGILEVDEAVAICVAIKAHVDGGGRRPRLRDLWWFRNIDATKARWLPEEAKPKRQLTPEEEAAAAATLERYARANPEYYPDHPVNRGATDAE